MRIEFIVLGITAGWLLLLTIGLVSVFFFFKRLTKSAKDLDIRKIFDKLIEGGDKNSEAIERLRQDIVRLSDEGTFHIQKVGLTKFNPFAETGGSNSFSLAVLDGKESGVILTGLHTRERTRLYVKTIKNGKSDLELSNEEKMAFKKALKD